LKRSRLAACCPIARLSAMATFALLTKAATIICSPLTGSSQSKSPHG